MPTSEPELDARAVGISIDDEALTVDLADGRRLIVPLSWFPRLSNATAGQRSAWRLIDEGRGIHWPEVDEDVSIAGLLRGRGASKRAM